MPLSSMIQWQMALCLHRPRHMTHTNRQNSIVSAGGIQLCYNKYRAKCPNSVCQFPAPAFSSPSNSSWHRSVIFTSCNSSAAVCVCVMRTEVPAAVQLSDRWDSGAGSRQADQWSENHTRSANSHRRARYASSVIIRRLPSVPWPALTNHSSICLRRRDSDDVDFSMSRPFWPLPVVVGNWWVWLYQYGVFY